MSDKMVHTECFINELQQLPFFTAGLPGIFLNRQLANKVIKLTKSIKKL